jgi:hypothetical protein
MMACLALSAMSALSCTAADRSGPTTGGERQVAVLLYGFFNSETRERFDPKPIRYVSVNLEDAHRAIAEKARALPWPTPVQVLSWQATEPLLESRYSGRGVNDTLRAALDVLDGVAKRRTLPEQQLVRLRAPARLPAGWGAEDRVLVIVGLEIAGQPNAAAVTSVLGCFWFAGDGSYMAFVAAPYDSTYFATSDVVSISDRCFHLSNPRNQANPWNAEPAAAMVRAE